MVRAVDYPVMVSDSLKGRAAVIANGNAWTTVV